MKKQIAVSGRNAEGARGRVCLRGALPSCSGSARARPLCLRPHTRSTSSTSPYNLRERGRGIRIKKLNSNKYGGDDTKALFTLCTNAVPVDTAGFPWGHFVLTSDPDGRGEMRHFWGFIAEPSTPARGSGAKLSYQSILGYLLFFKR